MPPDVLEPLPDPPHGLTGVPVGIKALIAFDHLRTAAQSARVCSLLDQRARPLPEPWPARYRHHAAISVFFSVAALEAAINELFSMAADRYVGAFKDSPADLMERMVAVWPDAERADILAKYALVARLANREPLPEDKTPYQPAKTLVQLRNALVHFKPEWDTAPEDHLKMERRLRSYVTPNPHASEDLPFIPVRVLGHSCASWAVATTLNYMHAFAALIPVVVNWASDDPELAVVYQGPLEEPGLVRSRPEVF